MPISSTEIAAMNGGFQGMAMNQQAYANMIGQPPGYYGGGPNMSSIGERTMGAAMNRGSAIGAPLAMGAMGLAGLDPLSIGIKAGMGAFRGGLGFGGAIGAGALAAAPVAAGMAVVSFAGDQLIQGAQQQMQLNNTLRSSFNFQNRQGGQGFNQSDMGQIGGVLRSMTEQFGPGGEVTGFRELTQLTQKMGSMGLAQGVRDVQEFSKRFKEMVTHLKTMAKDLGTTLEGAMEFASAARGSGVFGMSNASRFATMARSTAVSGGLAMSEVTGAASIGSQISRSIGGLGSQGAMAGMRTIGQIGTATQMGILSEQDIYNVTGLTGAEGKQAYATSQMQRTAGFLQSGRGRRVLASLAGKDGTLNEDNVEQLLSGGMSISQTMAKDQENLGKIGRANFIRNEGRLRGAALGRIGGFMPALQLQQWAQEKGVDINNMDDRSMLFAQRQLGMGRDEVDQAVKMAQALPAILREQHTAGQNDLIGQRLAQQRKHIGVEGIKTRFEQAAESVNGKLQKIGQDILSQGSEAIDHFMNSLLGVYVTSMNADADRVFQAAAFSPGGMKSARRFFGASSSPDRQGFTGKAGASGFSRAGAGASFDQFTRGASGNDSFGKSPLQAMQRLLQGESQRSQYEKAGFSFSSVDKLPTAERDGALNAQLNKISMQAIAANAPPDASLLALGKNNAGWLQEFAATSLYGLNATEHIAAFGEKLLKETGGGGLNTWRGEKTQLRAKWLAADEVEKVRIIKALEGAAGGLGVAGIGQKFTGLPDTGFATEGWTTDAKRRSDLAGMVLGLGQTPLGPASGADQAAIREAARGNFSGNEKVDRQRLAQARAQGLVSSKTSSMSAESQQAMGAVIEQSVFGQLVDDVFNGDKETREQAKDLVYRKMNEIPAKGNDTDQGQRAAWESLAAASDFSFTDRSDEAARRVASKYGTLREKGLVYTAADLEQMGTGLKRGQAALGGEAAKGMAARRKEAGRAELSNITSSGLATFDAAGNVSLSKGTVGELAGIQGGREILEAAFGVSGAEANLDASKGSTASQGLWGAGGVGERRAGIEELIARQSTRDTRKMASLAAGTDYGSRFAEAASTKERLYKSLTKRHGGVTTAASEGLGLSLSADEKKNFGLDRQSIGPDTQETVEKQNRTAAYLTSKLGVEGEANRKRVQALVQQYESELAHGDVGHAQKTLKGIEGDESVVGAKKKQKEQSDEQKDPFGKKTVDLLHLIAKHTAGTKEELEKMDKGDSNPEKPAQAAG